MRIAGYAYFTSQNHPLIKERRNRFFEIKKSNIEITSKEVIPNRIIYKGKTFNNELDEIDIAMLCDQTLLPFGADCHLSRNTNMFTCIIYTD
jgi:hypothetical protein